ncbi:hypothetical protein Q765_14450 [Flavobacterium rivuli WB 3.3-2 = DSM 21788]|uniref:Lipoprotein n=1 Tax=Flavobacterium rivuli WB 3.3-2 = DSM 21788 TaxID=1121895 RepID=A0A0A2LZL9_9FLAO|nr:hypothetical protein [Flavobacterium rivuli]KGO85822.1 hypothetical protein Q765_14450 [Flavobacterium rivuli WB 3.3-2 = DSM 21788]
MKTRIFILAAILSLGVISCKKDADTKTTETSAETAEVKPDFKVEVDAATDKNDDFAVYYTEDGSTNFTADKALWAGIKAGSEQKLMFQFPDGIVPKALRLDFGLKTKENQGNVLLKKVKITCYNKDFEIKGSDFFTYFVKNDSIDTQIDAAAGTITFKQNLKSNSAALYYPGAELNNAIAKLIK